jgi:UDP-GlcNAc:undecaprenyl-phosphate GlcNAc-1-phosphate transferase
LLLSLIAVVTTVYAIPDWLQLIAFVALFLAYKQSLSHIWRLVSLYRKGKAYKRLAKRKNNYRKRLLN